jgi:hypothetical protein
MGMEKEIGQINSRVFDPERDNTYTYNQKNSSGGFTKSKGGLNFGSIASNNVLR